MKSILAICLLCLGSGVWGLGQTPPMPPDVPQKPRGHKSITQAENERQASQPKETTTYFPQRPYVQPATQRVLDEVARKKSNPVKPSPPTPHPGLKPPLRAPRQKP